MQLVVYMGSLWVTRPNSAVANAQLHLQPRPNRTVLSKRAVRASGEASRERHPDASGSLAVLNPHKNFYLDMARL